MRKLALFLSIAMVFSVSITASQPDFTIIPATDSVYGDFAAMAEAGLIKSVDSSYFGQNPISDTDAGRFTAEAAENYAAAAKAKPAAKKTASASKIAEYYEKYKEQADRANARTAELVRQAAEIEAGLKSGEYQELKEAVNKLSEEIFTIEEEFKLTTFRGVPPFKVMGMIMMRWQDVEGFGQGPMHHTSLGGSFMSLWTEGIVTSDVSFKLNLTFERPANEAEKNELSKVPEIRLPEYWGTGQRFLDKYTINLDLFGWRISSGFFWEDITPFIAKQILTERPVLFDRDAYALEETSMGHFENAFLHAFAKRGDIWSKHGWMGLGLYNMNLFGSRVKIMGGKAEKFNEYYDKLYLYEYAARWAYPFEVQGLIKEGEVGANFFNTSNDRGEIETLAPAAEANYPAKPDGYIQSATVAGGDFKLKLLDFLSLHSEFARSNYNGRMPKRYLVYGPDYNAIFGRGYDVYQDFNPPSFSMAGNAFFAKGQVDFNAIRLEVKYTRIDPQYVATAAAVIDTSYWFDPTFTPAGTIDPDAIELRHRTYAGDPTLLWNNMDRVSIFGNITIPNGFILLNYGTCKQIADTDNLVELEHFLFGNRLNGAAWWHYFFSNYGFPELPRDQAYQNYINRYPNSEKVLITDKWLTNKERVQLDYSGPVLTKKYYNNASVEFRYSLNKLIGFKNNWFIQGYGELATLSNGADFLVDYNPKKLLSQNIVSAFTVFGLTRKMNIMAFGAVERWTSANVLNDYDIEYLDNEFGVGFDYDFAPRTSLFMRVKRFIHKDVQMEEASFDGWSLLFELKNFF